ncbi:MAG: tetratricopeptide repeat protein [Candidatus Acidiferrales bacterium]
MRRRYGAFVALAFALVIVPAGAGWARAQSGQEGQQKFDIEESKAIKEQNERVMASDALIAQYNTAVQNKQWQQAADLVKQIIALNPDMWTYRQGLGTALMNLGQYDDAIKAFDAGIKLAQTELQSKPPDSEAAKAKTGLGMMLANEGNAYLKMKKNDLAIAAYTKAAELDPNPAVAYFNLCATQYNIGNTDGALAACDKAIAADPKKADAYFIRGSLLIASSTTDAKGKVIAPAGTVEALKKYLELAPDGPHAVEVKEMLEYVGVKQ